MSEWLLRATIDDVMVRYNGQDPPGATPGSAESRTDEKNVLVAVLAYPRSGAAVVTSLKEIDLPSGEPFEGFGDDPTFWDNGLFKEVVQGETALRVSISDRDRRNTFVRFLTNALGGGLGALLRGETGRLLGGMVGNLTKALSDAIAGTDQRVRNLTIALSDRAQIVVDSDGEISVPNAGPAEDAPIHFADGVLTLRLATSRDFSHTVLDRTNVKRPKPREEILLVRGEPNGYIAVRLEAVAR